jgi:DNA mismatch repair protein MutS
VDEISQRQSSVNTLLKDKENSTRLRERFKDITDIERLTLKINSGTANARDLTSLRDSLQILPDLKRTVTLYKNDRIKFLSDQIDEMAAVQSLIKRAIAEDPPHGLKEGRIIRDGFHEEIDSLRTISGSGKDFIASLQNRERERTGITSLKVGSCKR